MANRYGLFLGGVSGSGSPRAFQKMWFQGETLFKAPLERGRFGIHTTSLGIAAGETGIFVDSGSGITDVAEFLKLIEVPAVYGLQTHEHKDHIDTLHRNPFLGQSAGMLKEYFWPRLLGQSADTFQRSFMDWPVGPVETKRPKIFMPESLLDLGAVKVATYLQNHGFDVVRKSPGFSLGFRVETARGAIAVTTDHEIGQDPTYREKCAAFFSGAKILYHDLQYRAREYDGTVGICGGAPMPRKGWGHSTPEMLYEVVRLCKEPIGTLIIGHHDPERHTGDLEKFEGEVQKLFAPLCAKVQFGREGKYYSL
ncbi:MAG: MBL fold metallo-hydrolase [Candidatus Pacebacteria bacterium]|nr:MBL fold metallo-hydrolase [Candidatus Paceibacterota bacterium]